MTSKRDEKAQLATGAHELGVDLDDDAVFRLLRFLDCVYAWNRSAGLTAVARVDAVRLHLLDSLSAVPFLRSSRTIADLGSGAGLPGIPIAIACPEATVVLVETRRRKATFLSETIRELGCSNCRVYHGKAEDVRKLGLEVDAVVARAFLPPDRLAALGATLVRTGGAVVIMGGRRDDELAILARGTETLGAEIDESFTLPGGNERRRILVLRRTR